VTLPHIGRPLRQLTGDAVNAELAFALRELLLTRKLWHEDRELLDQMIPTAEQGLVYELLALFPEPPAPPEPPTEPERDERPPRRRR